MRKTLARWLRLAARRLDPGSERVVVTLPPVTWTSDPRAFAANGIAATIRYHVEGGNR